MTRADELLALAERVESLTGPDREVDAAIEVACRIFPPYAPKWARDWAGRVIAQGARCYLEHDDGQLGAHWSPSEYTASLDAAMTLVFEGVGFNLDRYWIREGARWKVEIATGGIPENPRKVFDCWDAHSAALATTVAALRARAALAAIETGAAA